MGFYLGIGGVLTYKNAGLQEVVQHIDLKHIVLETDAPYLTPVPHRGKRNQSAYVTLVAQKLAGIKGVDLEEVENVTAENAMELFQMEEQTNKFITKGRISKKSIQVHMGAAVLAVYFRKIWKRFDEFLQFQS